MTTFDTFDVDNLPAPSDCELEAADRANAQRHKNWGIFILFCIDHSITHNRPKFHEFVTRTCPGIWTRADLYWALGRWAWQHEAIIAAEDARDLANTQQDALT